MRILSLCNIFPPGYIGGYELAAEELVRGLIGRGHQVEMLTTDYFVDDAGGDEGGPGRPTVRRTLEGDGSLRAPAAAAGLRRLGAFAVPRTLRELAGRLAALRPDAVLCFNLAGLGAPSVLRLLVATGMRPVLYVGDDMFAAMNHEPAGRQGFERIFGTADWPDATRFLFISRHVQDEVEATLGFRVRQARVIPGWYDAPAAGLAPASGAACPSADPPPPVEVGDPVTRFVFASRIAPHKGIDVALEACATLLEAGRADFSLVLYGAGDAALALHRIAALRLGGVVHHAGTQEKAALQALFGQYDALLFPTWQREPFGLVPIEAAAAGCLPVMTRGIGVAEWFKGGDDCLLVERDPASLARAMLQVMDMPRPARLAMRGRAQATARRCFRFTDALDVVETSLREAAAPPARPRAMEAALTVLTETWQAALHERRRA